MYIVVVPYIVLVVIYIIPFRIYEPTPPAGTISSGIFKCLPIAFLLCLVLLAPSIDHKHDAYRKTIALGLVFSILGDWCLNWQRQSYRNFALGLVCFAFALFTYSYSFGLLHPIGWPTAFTFAAAAAFMMKILIPSARPGYMKPAVVIYILLLALMGWRATARYKEKRTLDTWLAMAGAVSFCVSDFLIGFNRWKTQVSRAVLYIMLTYYVAQIFYVLSVLLPIVNTAKAFKIGV